MGGKRKGLPREGPGSQESAARQGRDNSQNKSVQTWAIHRHEVVLLSLLWSTGNQQRSIFVETGREDQVEEAQPYSRIALDLTKTTQDPVWRFPAPPCPTYLPIFICWLQAAEQSWLTYYVSCLSTLVFLRRCNIWGRSLRRQDYMNRPWAQHGASVELGATMIVQIDTRKKNKQNSPHLNGNSESEGKIGVLGTAGSTSAC